MWLNAAYIIPNFFRTTLYCDRAIGTTLCYTKLALIWSFIFVCSMIIEHDFISNFLVIVNSFTIFADIIFLNFSLILLTY